MKERIKNKFFSSTLEFGNSIILRMIAKKRKKEKYLTPNFKPTTQKYPILT